MYELEFTGPIEVWSLGYSGDQINCLKLYFCDGAWFDTRCHDGDTYYVVYTYQVYLSEEAILLALMAVQKAKLSYEISRTQSGINKNSLRLDLIRNGEPQAPKEPENSDSSVDN
jgi:hypothetical protein